MPHLKFFNIGGVMTEEQLETRMAQIVDQMGYLMMDILLMSLKKINSENQLPNNLKHKITI